MQDLESEFYKIFRGSYPRTLTAGEGDPLPHPTQRKRPGVGTQTLVPFNFSAVVAPLAYFIIPHIYSATLNEILSCSQHNLRYTDYQLSEVNVNRLAIVQRLCVCVSMQ